MVFRDYTERAAHELARIMREGENDDLRLRAASVILQRGWGDAPKALITNAIGEHSRAGELTEADIIALLSRDRPQQEAIDVQATEEAPPIEGDEPGSHSGTG
jgi:hypothetical protein